VKFLVRDFLEERIRLVVVNWAICGCYIIMIMSELGSLRFDLFYLDDVRLLKSPAGDLLREENGMCWRLLK
jgi:hypothetical protein